MTFEVETCCHINPLKAELNPICHFLALLGTHHILHVCRIRVKDMTLTAFVGGNLFLVLLQYELRTWTQHELRALFLISTELFNI